MSVQGSTTPGPAVITTASLFLDGYTPETFGILQRTQFVAAIAAILGVQPSAVAITGISTQTARRKLVVAGVTVFFTITTDTSQVAALAAVATPAGVAQLHAQGLSLVTAPVLLSAVAAYTSPAAAPATANGRAAAIGLAVGIGCAAGLTLGLLTWMVVKRRNAGKNAIGKNKPPSRSGYMRLKL